MTQTEVYEFNKPAQTDTVNIGDLNENADKMEEALLEKVDKVSGKALSSNDFTNAYKGKLDNLDTALNGKVDKVSGKGLSANDFTSTLKQGLEGLLSPTYSFNTDKLFYDTQSVQYANVGTWSNKVAKFGNIHISSSKVTTGPGAWGTYPNPNVNVNIKPKLLNKVGGAVVGNMVIHTSNGATKNYNIVPAFFEADIYFAGFVNTATGGYLTYSQLNDLTSSANAEYYINFIYFEKV